MRNLYVAKQKSLVSVRVGGNVASARKHGECVERNEVEKETEQEKILLPSISIDFCHHSMQWRSMPKSLPIFSNTNLNKVEIFSFDTQSGQRYPEVHLLQ